MPPSAYHLHVLMQSATRQFSRLMEQHLKQEGIRAGQIPVFLALNDNSPLTQKALTDFAGVEQPGMATLLNRMERDGLIERHTDAQDKRVSQIVLSPEGALKGQNILPALESSSQVAFKDFTVLEQNIFNTLLERLNCNLARHL